MKHRLAQINSDRVVFMGYLFVFTGVSDLYRAYYRKQTIASPAILRQALTVNDVRLQLDAVFERRDEQQAGPRLPLLLSNNARAARSHVFGKGSLVKH